jgi:hypothetical protein
VTGCLKEQFFHVGKNNSRIYMHVTKALYRNEMEDGIVVILINTHYPTDLRTILIDPTATELTKAVIHLTTNPEEEPNIEEKVAYNPILGTYEAVKKTTKKEEIKKEEKKEDLE